MSTLNKITTLEIEEKLARYFDYRQNLVIPNLSWGLWIHECDLFVVRKSGFGIEVEIKISKHDLIKDTNKRHHHIDRFNRIKELWFAIPPYLERYIEYIPIQAGILIVEPGVDVGINKTRHVSVLRQAKSNNNAQKLTDKEIQQLMRLMAMRVWSMKRKLIKCKSL